jgi:PAS domain S-box-containing protein
LATATELGYEVLATRVETLQSVFKGLPLGVVVADSDGRILLANPAAERILGNYPAETPSLAKSVYAWYLPDQVTIVSGDQLPLARAIRGEEVSDELAFVRHFQQHDGIWIRVTAWPLRDSSGSVTGGVAVFHDCTQNRHAMQTLELLSRAVAQTADSVIVTDPQGIIQYVNPAFELTTGYSKQEVTGQTPRLLKSGLHDAEFYRQIWLRLGQGEPFKGMVINRKKNGDLYWAQQTITPMRDETGHRTHFVSVLQDITQLRKEQEHQFQLQLARSIQQRFYPTPPILQGFDIGAAAHPADETGGDYFDFITMEDGSIVIAVGDVRGHGFGAALIMAITRAYLRCYVSMHWELDKVLTQLNGMLLKDVEHGHFVTLALARLDLRHRTLSFASAGHVPGFVLLESGETRCVLRSTGPPLALFSESKFFVNKDVVLNSGETVVLLTDGITESTTPEGNQFGTERVLNYVRSHRHERAQEIANGLYHAAREYVRNDPQDDDITSVVITVDR